MSEWLKMFSDHAGKHYHLGFKEGAAWACAILNCKEDAYYSAVREDFRFFCLWATSLEEGQ